MKSRKTLLIIIAVVLVVAICAGIFLLPPLFAGQSDDRSKSDSSDTTKPTSHTHAYGAPELLSSLSCTQDEVTVSKCACGDEQFFIKPSQGHSFGEPATTRDATCLVAGEAAATCSICNQTQTQQLPRTKHHYTITDNPEDGTCNYVCDLCGDAFTVDADLETDLTGTRYSADCDDYHAFRIYCPEDEAYIRQHLYITDSYYQNTPQQQNLAYNVTKQRDSYWLITPVEPYKAGNIYLASRSGAVLFEDLSVQDMTFQIHREQSVQMELSENVIFLQTLENSAPGYYPYTMDYSAASDSYWLTLQKSTGLNPGDLICVGNAQSLEDVLQNDEEADFFGQIKQIHRNSDTTGCLIELVSPDLTELFSVLDIYSSEILSPGNIQLADPEQMTRQTQQILYQSDDFAKFICSARATAGTYLSARGYTTPLSTLKDFFNSIEIDKENTQTPDIHNGVISGKIAIKGSVTIPITLSSDPDSEKLGSIKLYFTASVSLDSMDFILHLENQTVQLNGEEKDVKAQIGSQQKLTVGFTIGAQVDMDWSAQAKPYVLNNKTGKYHYANCKHVSAVKDPSVLTKMTAQVLFEKLSDESILVDHECKTCLPLSSMMTDSYILNTESKTIHLPTCPHIKKATGSHIQVSQLPYGNLLAAGYSDECDDCSPSSRYTNSFSEQVLQKMKYEDLGSSMEEFKELAKEISDGAEATQVDVARIPFTITGLDMTELYLALYFDFTLDATLEYQYENKIDSRFGIYLTKKEFLPYSDFTLTTTKSNLTLTGKARVDLGVAAGINIHLLGLEKYCFADLNAKVGPYAKVQGALQYDFINSRNNYAAAYFEAGIHCDLVGRAKVAFLDTKAQSFIPADLQDRPLLSYGYEKLYYNFAQIPHELVIDTIYYDLNDADLMNVKYYNILKMEGGTDKLSIMGIKDKYDVTFKLKDGSHCTVSSGYLLVTDPYESFTDELTITVTGYDTWGKYRRGNTCYDLESFAITIRYDATLADTTAPQIPADAFEYNGHYYKVINDSLTWEEAKQICQDQGGHLLTITDADEQEFITSLLTDAVKNCYWTGGLLSDGAWQWITGEEFLYSNWAANEPNNDSNKEAYIHLFGKVWTGGIGTKYVGDWNDVSNVGASYANDFYAQSNFGYICEWDTLPSGDRDEQLTPEERMNALVGYYQGWYTATQGITGGALGVHRTNGLLNDEAALQMYADWATSCSQDKDGNITRIYTVQDIRDIVKKHPEEYIAIYMFGPLRENPSVEDGLYTMTVSYNEGAQSYEFYGSEWIQHDTYEFVDLKQTAFHGDTFFATVYGNKAEWFWTTYDVVGELSMVRFAPSFLTGEDA